MLAVKGRRVAVALACLACSCTEELFNKLANEEVVSSEAAGLVVALAYLDLQVTEEKVVEATREILQPTENQFSKDAFCVS